MGHPERVSKPACGSRAGLCRRPLLTEEGASQAFMSTLSEEAPGLLISNGWTRE